MTYSHDACYRLVFSFFHSICSNPTFIQTDSTFFLFDLSESDLHSDRLLLFSAQSVRIRPSFRQTPSIFHSICPNLTFIQTDSFYFLLNLSKSGLNSDRLHPFSARSVRILPSFRQTTLFFYFDLSESDLHSDRLLPFFT